MKETTATLVGMLVDDGRLRWDDPVETYLPEFKLAVQRKDPNDRANAFTLQRSTESGRRK